MKLFPSPSDRPSILLFAGLLLAQLSPLLAEPDRSQLLASVDEVLEAVVELRQLEPKEKIQRGIRSREEIRDYLIDRIEEDFPQEDILAEEKMLRWLELIPEDLKLYPFMLDLLTEQVAGYYDPHEKTLYLADWISVDLQKPVIAHELLHALQDQYFGLKQFLEKVEGNDDQTLARNALIEGEGLAVMLSYSLQPLGQDFLDIPDIVGLNRAQLPLMAAEFPIFASAPAYLRETLMFPYSYGAVFLQEYLRSHSWDQVAEIYADLPQSSEQILHPEKYFVQRDSPTLVTTEGLEAALEGSWESIFETVLGEYTLYLLLEGRLGAEEAERAAEGWDGDSVHLLENGDESVLLMTTIWDSDEDALEFLQAYRNLMEARFPAIEFRSERNGEDGMRYITEQPRHRITIEHSGRGVDLSEFRRH